MRFGRKLGMNKTLKKKTKIPELQSWDWDTSLHSEIGPNYLNNRSIIKSVTILTSCPNKRPFST